MMSGRSRLSAYENVVNQKPGRSSSVIAAPPDEVSSLEDERPQPGLGQVGAVRQPVVAAADDDRVVATAVGRRSPGFEAAARRVEAAASRPFDGAAAALRRSRLGRAGCPTWSSACQAVLRSGLNRGGRVTKASKYS